MEKFSIDDVNDRREKLIPAHVKEIRSILEEKHNLMIPEQCDQFIARCLRVKDGNLENAIKIILAFHTTIKNFGQWDVDLRPSTSVDIYQAGVVDILKNRDSRGRCILIGRFGLWDTERMSYKQAVTFLWMLIQLAQAYTLDIQRLGLVVICDYSHYSLKHALATDTSTLLRLMKWAQNGVLGRVAEINVVNHPRIASFFYKAIGPFLKEKMKKRIFFHDSVDEMQKHLGENNLPTSLGGTLDPDECSDRDLMQRVFASDQYFRDMLEVGFPSK